MPGVVGEWHRVFQQSHYIKSESVEELVHHPNLDQHIKSMSLGVSAREDYITLASVSINLSRWYLTYEIEGRDELWVLGKQQQLNQFLQARRTWYGRWYYLINFVVGWVALWVAYNAIFTIVSPFLGNTVNLWLYIIQPVLLLAAVITYWLLTTRRILPHVDVRVGASRKLRTTEDKLIAVGIWTVIFTAIAALFAAIQFIDSQIN
jgi:hypothetical protein